MWPMSTSPEVVGLFRGALETGPIETVDELEAVAGAGIVGDRYFNDPRNEPKREITLFESEEIERANAELGLDVTAEDMRRNVMTRGIELGPLVGRRFFVGEVEIEGIKLNPPCAHLQQLAGKKLLVKDFMKSGGIRARIVSTGSIRVGDPVEVPDQEA